MEFSAEDFILLGQRTSPVAASRLNRRVADRHVRADDAGIGFLNLCRWHHKTLDLFAVPGKRKRPIPCRCGVKIFVLYYNTICQKRKKTSLPEKKRGFFSTGRQTRRHRQKEQSSFHCASWGGRTDIADETDLTDKEWPQIRIGERTLLLRQCVPAPPAVPSRSKRCLVAGTGPVSWAGISAASSATTLSAAPPSAPGSAAPAAGSAAR